MAKTLFKNTQYKLAQLVEQIDRGEIGLPDIQRPFVWDSAKVRDLFDSMYKGFPVGILLMWNTNAEAGARQIGVNTKQASVPQLMVVDGQQRLTSLYSVFKSQAIKQKNYKEAKIQICFSPIENKFEVYDIAVGKDPNFIADISQLFGDDYRQTVRDFFAKYESSNEPLTQAERDLMEDRIDKVHALQYYEFMAVELLSDVDEEQVADIFVRINSKGKQLNQADFILTLMSVWWDEGRTQLEKFCEEAAEPDSKKPNAYTHIVNIEPSMLLRVAVAIAFKRGRLRYAYLLLQGKDLETGKFDADRRTEQFGKLAEAQNSVIDLNNWHEFLKSIQRAGYYTSRQVTSAGAVTFAYMLWLIGKDDFKIEKSKLQGLVAKWFFMSHTTQRYSSSPESQYETDLKKLESFLPKGQEGFEIFINTEISNIFTNDYWELTFPNKLDVFSPRSPAFMSYWASLIILDANALFSKSKVSTLIDPAVRATRDVEIHHIFPQNYLMKAKGLTRQGTNSCANLSFVDWPENLEASDKPPIEYFPNLWSKLTPEEQETQSFLHALPTGWADMDYQEFLEKRRFLLAKVVRKAFEKLSNDGTKQFNSPNTIAELLDRGESLYLEYKSTARWNIHLNDQDKKMEHIIIKTVAGFMNTEGGTLLIGVDDDGIPVGLENDYKTIKKNDRDGFELFLTDLLSDKINREISSLIKIDFDNINGNDVCRLRIQPSGNPVYTKPLDGSEHSEFWVRINNSTRQLHGPDTDDYKKERWG